MPHPQQMSKPSDLFFRTHIKNFIFIAAPLFKLARNDSGYKDGPLPKEAMEAFCILKNSLVSEPVMAFPSSDRQYALITDAATGTADRRHKMVISTQKQWTGYRQHYWNMILSSSTRKVPSCLQIIFLAYPQATATFSQKSQNALTHFNQTSSTCRKPTLIYNTFLLKGECPKNV